MTDPLRWGVAGTGWMAREFSRDFAEVPDAKLVAVGSRCIDSARTFAETTGVQTAHGSYRALISDPRVDVVYVATPHPQHYAIARAAIEAGKPVVVEKAFTATYDGAREIVELARERGVYCMEAMWSRFLPPLQHARQLVNDGAIGDVRIVQADLGALRTYDPSSRLFDPALGGGATLDLGVYVVSIAQFFLGAPDHVAATGSRYPNGVDASVAISLSYPDGRAASLMCSLESESPGRAVIIGSQGSIEIEPRVHHPSAIVVRQNGQELQRLTFTTTGRGYAHEIDAACADLRAGRTENKIVSLQDTLEVQHTLQRVLDIVGQSPHEDRTLHLD